MSQQGNYDEARAELTRVLALRRELGDRHGEAAARHELARDRCRAGQLRRGPRRAHRASSRCAASSATATAKPTPATTSPGSTVEQGNYERARAPSSPRVLALRRELGDRHGEAVTRHAARPDRRQQGNYDEARAELSARPRAAPRARRPPRRSRHPPRARPDRRRAGQQRRGPRRAHPRPRAVPRARRPRERGCRARGSRRARRRRRLTARSADRAGAPAPSRPAALLRSASMLLWDDDEPLEELAAIDDADELCRQLLASRGGWGSSTRHAEVVELWAAQRALRTDPARLDELLRSADASEPRHRGALIHGLLDAADALGEAARRRLMRRGLQAARVRSAPHRARPDVRARRPRQGPPPGETPTPARRSAHGDRAARLSTARACSTRMSPCRPGPTAIGALTSVGVLGRARYGSERE